MREDDLIYIIYLPRIWYEIRFLGISLCWFGRVHCSFDWTLNHLHVQLLHSFGSGENTDYSSNQPMKNL